ncbi:iron dicitrate transport regulator FecR [Achromobacter sp. RTa]|uniref:FecR domain-containing protein n=1 Tax=Achromobacter sp. RTa TaxID=1532557 RepID=UPI00050F67B6|nr:FecR family protein [Achromobacter sp. RTa]KGD92357.1 iron dicitrate transport regulator FecR [Achromobacter sp. RTa]
MSAAQAERLHPDIIEQAAQWMMRTADAPDAATEAACVQWRQADTRHELAWQRLQGISRDLDAATGAKASRTAAGETILRYCDQRSRRSALKWVVGGIGLGTLGWAGWRQGLWDGPGVYRTAIGEQQVMTLPDGTVLTMNTDSAVALRYDSLMRRIDLRSGEILVATAADAAGRPFSVKTPNGLLTPLGTRFAVRQMDDSGGATRISVYEGAVRVEPAARAQSAWVVHAGEQAEFDRLALSPATPAEGAGPAWSAGMLVANRMRLDRFLAELGRYRAGILRCDADVADREVTGAFRIDDTGKALEVLASALGLTLRYRTRYWVSVGRA